MTIGSSEAVIDGNTTTLDVPPQIVNERTLVPVRFIAESLDCNVFWEPNTYTVTITDLKNDFYVEGNVYNPAGNTYGKYMAPSGKTANNEAYFYTSMIEVPENATVYFTDNRLPYKVRFVAVFDKDKKIIDTLDYQNVSEITQEGMRYIIVTASVRQKEGLVISFDNTPDFYVPEEICVAVGKNISIYNKSIISKNYDEYEFVWSGSIGTQEKDKYTIIADAAKKGTHILNLTVKDSNGINVFEKDIKINVVENTIAETAILPIGDSLTNNKQWLSDVRKMSDNKITFVGTRGIKNLNHEGRSGFSSTSYMIEQAYTFQQEGVHPFWDGNGFSWQHYKEQTGIVPDAVQIFLGTNQLTINPRQNAQNIVHMVRDIHSVDPNMPVFIVNTMYRGPVYNDDGTLNTSAVESQHLQIFNLTEHLTELLKDDENVHMIPVAFVHNSDNNYSETDSIHPMAEGYEEIANIMYSTYCAFID
ncbi:MAG: hypothetical protein IJ366_09545 [Clostridia bacterium]|nr:hypothetical protein [Clostridia bacterium]